MKFSALVSITSTFLVAVIAELGPLNQIKDAIKGQYIINLKGNSRTTLEAHVKSVKELFTERDDSNEIKYVYSALGMSYSAKLSESILKKVRNLPEVAYVEADGIASINVEQKNAPWGLNRISQRAKLPASGPYKYTYNADGSGVAVYVIDTGIWTKHPEFEGRAVHGASFPPYETTDDHGHGTHCAGTIGSKTYGVSKKVSLIGIKVLSEFGYGTVSDIIAGINWVTNDKRGTKGNVISMSFGTNKTQSLNDAVTAAYNKGFVTVVSAGNDKGDSCVKSPASTPEAITVAASDVKDARASFSNWGKCVDVFAPGVDVLSTWIDDETLSISGTSMACPHVAGLAAYYLSTESLTNAEVTKKIISTSTKNAITDSGTDTPNLLVFNSAR